MLTRSLVLSAIWLVLSAVATMLWKPKLQRRNVFVSMLWLLLIIAAGDVWALAAFGQPWEVVLLSLVALWWGALWIVLLPDWNWLGQVAWAMSVMCGLLFIAYSFAVVAFTPLHVVSYLLSFVLFSAETFAIGLSLTFTFETLDVCTRFRWRRRAAATVPRPGYGPKVSLHVPAYNEPPSVVEHTLRALSKLDYPNYEVILVDNNTPDQRLWRPLEALCRQLGPNFKCLHLDQWPGYKAGALNFALTQTAPDAELVGIVDADYQVRPEYLRETVPYFASPAVAFLQTPQDYRAYQGNPFLEACYDAYKYFFEVSMPSRNEHNAIIFGGTMGLIRTAVLREIGGWDEWCITEDAEASLRILQRGYDSVYVNRSYGQGIMPLNFEGLKKQRFRWCFGGVQILRKHWEALMPWAHWVDPTNCLTFAQRYFYLASALQWFNELVTMGFTAVLLIGSIAGLMGWRAGMVQPITGVVAVVPLVFLLLGLWRFVWALRRTLNLTARRALRAMASYFSLSWVVALASIQGLVQPRGVFLRTPKSESTSSVLRALRVTQWETSIGTLCGVTGVIVALRHPPFVGWLAVFFLTWQASLYLSAPTYSLLSERGRVPTRLTSRADIGGQAIGESRAARWTLTIVAGVLLAFVVFRFLPQPVRTPTYANLQPAELQPQQIIGAPAIPTATTSPTSIPTGMPLNPTPTARPTRTPTPIFVAQPSATPNPPPTPRPLPTQALTAQPTPNPLPTQVPTPRPTSQPTQAPTQKPMPSQVPTPKR